jgi:AcrR family transcriptional regulator
MEGMGMRREERREQILACAREVFAEKGYYRTSVSDIIERAGVARGTFYQYFRNKRSIFDELLERLIQALARTIKRIDPSHPHLSPVAQMRDNVFDILDVLLQNRALTKILLHEAVGLDPGFDEKLDAFYGRVLAMIEKSLKVGQVMGLVRPCDSRLAGYCILGMIKEVMYRLTLSGEQPADREAFVDEILNFGLRGLFLDRNGA